MLPLFLVGVLLYLAGSLVGTQQILLLGASISLIGSILFAHLIWLLMSHGGDRLSHAFMLLGCIALSSSILLSTYFIPVDRSALALLLLSYPILFILGERVELTKFTTNLSERLRFKAALIVASIALALLISHAVLAPVFSDIFLILPSSIGYLLVTITVYSTERSGFKRLSASPSPLQRYLSLHTQLAYLWILTGMISLVAYSTGVTNPHLYDAFIHSLGVGFVGTMILAHGPIVMPVLLGKSLRTQALSLIPLSLLTLANGVRFSGDILKPLYPDLAYAVGYSGPLILITILAFLMMMRRALQPPP